MIVVPAGDKTLLVGQYVAEKTGCTFDPGMYQAMAVLDDNGAFCAGVIVSDFRDYDCQLSCATETSAAWRDSVLRGVFNYVFIQLGVVRCTSLTRKSNKRARAFLEGLGFKLEGRIRKGFDGVKDALIYGLLREECRYIQEVTDDRQGSDEAAEAPGTTEAPAAADDTPQAVAGEPDVPTGQEVAEFW